MEVKGERETLVIIMLWPTAETIAIHHEEERSTEDPGLASKLSGRPIITPSKIPIPIVEELRERR